MNYELRIKSKKSIFLSLFIILYSLFFIHGMASAWILGEPIVPCGGQGACVNNVCTYGPTGPCINDSSCQDQPSCSQCELLHLVDNLMDFILIAAAPILATFFFILAGLYIMLGGAKPDMLATGKRMFTSALVGIIIVMLAWLITNTLITTLIVPTLTLGNMPFNSADWWQLYCGTINLNPNPPGAGSGGGGGGGGGGGTILVISGERAINISSSNATITWTTNVAASSEIRYTEINNPVWTTANGPGNVTSHSVLATGLLSGRTYQYQAISVDSSGYRAVGSVRTFQTP